MRFADKDARSKATRAARRLKRETGEDHRVYKVFNTTFENWVFLVLPASADAPSAYDPPEPRDEGLAQCVLDTLYDTKKLKGGE